jgi:hypothetical protein
MQIKPNDILVRRQENEVPAVWLSEQFLLMNLEGLSKAYLDRKARPVYKSTVQPCHKNKSFLPDTRKSWRWGKAFGQFYYAYDNIPEKQPTNYLGQLPSRLKLIEMSKQLQATEVTPLETFFNQYIEQHYHTLLPYYADCTKTQQVNLAKAATLCMAAVLYKEQFGIDTSKSGFFKDISSFISANDFKYLPKNYRNLKSLINGGRFTTSQQAAGEIKLPRAGNSNAAAHCNDDEIQSWLLELRKEGRNYTDSHIIRKVEWMCKVTEKRIPSYRWMQDFLSQHNTRWLTGPERFGEKGRHGQQYRGYIPFQNALHAGDCWQVDGTRVNFIDFQLNGKNVFLYIVAVRDVHSGDILGYSFDISENRWVVHNALKMAVEQTGYLPYQLSMDRFPGHNTEEMTALFDDLKNRGVKVTFMHKATGKASLERWFSTNQQVFMQASNYYYGEGIQSRNKFAHRSKEQLKKMRQEAKKDGWNFDTAVNEACKTIEAYRSTKLSHYSRKFSYVEQSPAELHIASEKPNIIALETHQIVYLFGLRTQRKFTGEGLLNIDIQSYPFSFRCQDPEVVSKYDRVTICYDLEDLTQVHLYEITDRPLKKYLGTAQEVSVQIYGPNPQWGKFNEQQAIIRSLNDERQRQLSMKMAVGSEVTVLLQGEISKGEYETAETAILVNQFNENSGPDSYDIRDQY